MGLYFISYYYSSIFARSSRYPRACSLCAWYQYRRVVASREEKTLYLYGTVRYWRATSMGQVPPSDSTVRIWWFFNIFTYYWIKMTIEQNDLPLENSTCKICHKIIISMSDHRAAAPSTVIIDIKVILWFNFKFRTSRCSLSTYVSLATNNVTKRYAENTAHLPQICVP